MGTGGGFSPVGGGFGSVAVVLAAAAEDDEKERAISKGNGRGLKAGSTVSLPPPAHSSRASFAIARRNRPRDHSDPNSKGKWCALAASLDSYERA